MLTAKAVAALKKPGRYADRDGLYLQITKAGVRSWTYRYQLNGKRREMGLGTLRDLTLKQARVLASEARNLHKKGIDPKAHRDSQRRTATDSQVWTFDKCAAAYIEAHAPGWKNTKHADQWRNTLKQYASPVFGHMPVDRVDTGLVMQVLEPIWHNRTETASRVRGRIENILSWSIVRGYRAGPNPALWRGHLAMLLPQRLKVQRVQHHAALPYLEIGAFMVALRKRKALSAKALELVILTATRTNEALQAKWDEVDLEAAVWTLPGDRMKSGREHRAPLPGQAVALLASLGRANEWVFPSRNDRPLSNMAMLMLLKQRMERPNLTVHGFRSCFRDWAAEVSPFPRELAESALAHALADKTEAAYQRGDLLEKRRLMMQTWADFCDRSGSAKVVPLERKA
jgi:integrase